MVIYPGGYFCGGSHSNFFDMEPNLEGQSEEGYDIAEGSWFTAAQDRANWMRMCREGLEMCTEKHAVLDRVKCQAIQPTQPP